MIHLHCVAERVPRILRNLGGSPDVQVTVYVRSGDEGDAIGGVEVYPLAPRREPREASLVGTELAWKLEGERSRLGFLLIRNAVRGISARDPDARHVLVSFPGHEVVAERVADDLRLQHVECRELP